MEKEEGKAGYWQCSHRLLNVVEDMGVAVLAHKILFSWQTRKRDKEDYVPIKDSELSKATFCSTRTINRYVSKLEEINFLETKRVQGFKYYKINKKEAKKYFNRI